MAEAKQEKQEKREERAPTVWEPFGPLRDWSPFGAAFPTRWGRWLREFDEEWPWPSLGGTFAPALDVHETDQQYEVSVELPGVDKGDVTVEFHEGVLTVRGEKKTEKEEKKAKRRFVERRYGTFSRSFSLPSDADPEHIGASFKDGVLTLTIPKTEASKPRTVAIK